MAAARKEQAPDLQGHELVVLLPLLVFIFYIGLWPGQFTGTMDGSIRQVPGVQITSAQSATAHYAVTLPVSRGTLALQPTLQQEYVLSYHRGV